MASDFSRTLALLRKEKKISQRTAAADLEVSQALLSHYENGLREPGLGFVVRAADYYGVSCDYLLGRSMARDGSAVTPSRLRDVSTDPGEDNSTFALQRKLVVNSVALLFEIAEQTGSGQLSAEIASYLSLAVYKVFRYLYLADPESVEAAFRTPSGQFDGLLQCANGAGRASHPCGSARHRRLWPGDRRTTPAFACAFRSGAQFPRSVAIHAHPAAIGGRYDRALPEHQARRKTQQINPVIFCRKVLTTRLAIWYYKYRC